MSDACCAQDHAPPGHDRRYRGERRRVEQGALSLGVGLVPCTGAVLLLLYAVANDILFAGMVMVIAIACGMAMTMGGLGILSVVARRAVARPVETSAAGQGRFAVAMEYARALAITALGAALLWAALL